MRIGFGTTGQLLLVPAILGVALSGRAVAAPCVVATPAQVQESTEFQAQSSELLLSAGDIKQKVAAVVATDPGNGAAVLRLAPVANADQKKAIGEGLANAAKSCQANAPLEAFNLQTKVIEANDQEVLTAFLRGMSEVETTLAGVGGAPGAAAAGGSGISGTNAGAQRRVTPSEATGGGASSNVFLMTSTSARAAGSSSGDDGASLPVSP